jgi:hypothetical protein
LKDGISSKGLGNGRDPIVNDGGIGANENEVPLTDDSELKAGMII